MENDAAKGFSLMEMMIAVAIVGILAAIAYPSFLEKIRETRRTEAITLTTKIMQAQERFLLTT
ncbi:MAG: prepilin-type N-terminal cleavage/methylation domain-containing protein [Porticoccaceae bacterium]